MISDFGSVEVAAKIHVTALEVIRSRLPKSIPVGTDFEVRAGRVFIISNESFLLVCLDDVRVYEWERIGTMCETSYLTDVLVETLDTMQREMVLERLSDV